MEITHRTNRIYLFFITKGSLREDTCTSSDTKIQGLGQEMGVGRDEGEPNDNPSNTADFQIIQTTFWPQKAYNLGDQILQQF